MSNLNDLFSSAREVSLNMLEEDRAWQAVSSFMKKTPALHASEQADVRFMLQSFTQDFPRQSLLPLLDIGPLPLWTGVNLFGHLQPFCV